MADKNTIGHWLYQNKDRLAVTFSELSWPERYLPGYFDFSVSVTADGHVFEGRGISDDRHLALEKASAEAIERAIEYQAAKQFLGFSVSGFSGSQEHAYFEALERYYLRYHFLHRVPFMKIFSQGLGVVSIKQSLESQGAQLSFFKMGPPEANGIIAHIKSANHKVFFGFAAGKDLEGSCIRSSLEAASNFAWATDEMKRIGIFVLPKTAWHISPAFQDEMRPLLLEHTDVQNVFGKPLLHLHQIELDSSSEFYGAPIDPVGFVLEDSREVAAWPW